MIRVREKDTRSTSMNRTYHVVKAMMREIEKYEKTVPERETSVDWEKIHMISCGRLGYMLAKKRGEDPELASCACLVHDYGRIITGVHNNHAEEGYIPVRVLLRKLEFGNEEIDIISNAVRNHSKKSEIGGTIEEIVKDADVLDYYYYRSSLSRPDMVARLKVLLEENPDL